MREVEVKLRVQDVAALRTRLAACGAKPQGEGVEEDLYFLHPMRDFAATDEVLRLRRRGGALELTYKGPKVGARGGDGADGAMPGRVEFNVPVGGDPAALLSALDIHPGPMVRKRRERWRLQGVEVCLDELLSATDPADRTFAELEDLKGDAAAWGRIDAVRGLLGLASAQVEERSYLDLSL